MPPIAVPWPPIHFVAEWMTMSAPCSMGFVEQRGEGVVDDDRHALGVGDVGDGADVVDVEARVADGLEEHGLGALVDRRPEGLGLQPVDELHGDAQLGQRVVEQVVGAAVEAARGDDVVARAGEVEDRQRLGRLAGRDREGRDAALERGDALLEHPVGRVHDPGVDVPELLEPEQARRVGRVVEHVGGRGVDRDGARVGRWVRLLAGVQGLGLGVEVRQGAGIEAHGVWLSARWGLRDYGDRGPCGFDPGGSRRVVPENKRAVNPVGSRPRDLGTRDPRCHSLIVSAGSLGAHPPHGGAAHAYTSSRTRSYESSGRRGCRTRVACVNR